MPPNFVSDPQKIIRENNSKQKETLLSLQQQSDELLEQSSLIQNRPVYTSSSSSTSISADTTNRNLSESTPDPVVTDPVVATEVQSEPTQQQTFLNPSDRVQGTLREWFLLKICTISESLSKVSKKMRSKHINLFDKAEELRGQRNLLAHEYWQPAAVIDYKKVWKTLTRMLPHEILPKLIRAIEKEQRELGEN